MAPPTQWAWVWVNSGSWWWTGRPGVLWFMGSQRVGHDWATELNWTELNWNLLLWQSASPLNNTYILLAAQVKIFRVLLTALTNYIQIYQQILSVSSRKINPGSHCALPPPLPPLDQTTISSHLNYYCCLSIGLPNFTFISGAPNLQDLMPDDLQWSLCNNNRNKGHNKCNVLESFQNHPPTR